VVHGKVTNVEGRRFDHAWVEFKGKVFDPTSNVKMDKSKYYRLLKAKAEASYDSTDALVMSARTRNYGPWTKAEVAALQAVRKKKTTR